jgi:hypothetical protein
MAELKTKPSDASVEAYLNGLSDEQRRADCFTLLDLMAEVTGAEPTLWGGSIVGFGSYHYVYESGREGDWFLAGFAPRKQSLTLYIMAGFDGYEDLLGRLGKHKTGKSCLYVNRLEDVDLPTLRELVRRSVEHLAEGAFR